jgi:predicted Rossmann fold flavoprotein
MFPTSDSSQTIIDCFINEAKQLGVVILKEYAVKAFAKANQQDAHQPVYTITTSKAYFTCNYLVVTSGSNPKMWKQLNQLGHTITPAVPSLFTFTIKDKRIEGLMGLAVEAAVKVVGHPLEGEGSLLITHWGMSGPGILKLSAWGARILNELNYNFQISVNWLLYTSYEDALIKLQALKDKFARQSPYSQAQFALPKRLWKKLLAAAQIDENINWADLSNKKLAALTSELTQGIYQVNGKSTFKEEFVTAGGVNLKEVNFKTFESKVLPNLFLAGEVLNIDAITGGFNFQNAWTGGYHIAQAISERES